MVLAATLGLVVVWWCVVGRTRPSSSWGVPPHKRDLWYFSCGRCCLVAGRREKRKDHSSLFPPPAADNKSLSSASSSSSALKKYNKSLYKKKDKKSLPSLQATKSLVPHGSADQV